MGWREILLIGGNAAVSVSVVLLASLLQERRERDSWLADKRLAAAVRLKSAVGEVRADLVQVARSTDSGTRPKWSFSDVNAAMTEVELIGPSAVRASVDALRESLRELARVVSAGGDWRSARQQVDGDVQTVMDILRGGIHE